jgi:hypothetical protein
MKRRLSSSGIVDVSLQFAASSVGHGETVGLLSMLRRVYLVAQETLLTQRAGCTLSVCMSSPPGRKGVVDGQEVRVACGGQGEDITGGKCRDT